MRLPLAPTSAPPTNLVARQPLPYVFLVCWIGWALAQADNAIFSFLLPMIQKEFHLSLAQSGGIVALANLSTAIGVVVCGLLADRYGRKRLFQWTAGIAALCTAMLGAMPSLLLFTPVRALAAASIGSEAPITNAILTEEAPPRVRGILMSLLQTGYPAGVFLSSIVVVPLLPVAGWRWVFLVGVAPLGFVVILRLFFRETRLFRAHAQENLHHLQKSRTAWFAGIRTLLSPVYLRITLGLFLPSFLWAGASGGITPFLPQFLMSKGLSLQDAIYLVGFASLLGILGYLLAGIVGEGFVFPRFLTRRNTTMMWLALGAGSLCCLLFAQSRLSIFLCYALMVSFGSGVAAVKAILTTEAFPTSLRATGAGAAGSLAVNMGSALFPLITGYCIPRLGWSVTVIFFAIIPLLLGAGCLFLLPNKASGANLD